MFDCLYDWSVIEDSLFVMFDLRSSIRKRFAGAGLDIANRECMYTVGKDKGDRTPVCSHCSIFDLRSDSFKKL